MKFDHTNCERETINLNASEFIALGWAFKIHCRTMPRHENGKGDLEIVPISVETFVLLNSKNSIRCGFYVV